MLRVGLAVAACTILVVLCVGVSKGGQTVMLQGTGGTSSSPVSAVTFVCLLQVELVCMLLCVDRDSLCNFILFDAQSTPNVMTGVTESMNVQLTVCCAVECVVL